MRPGATQKARDRAAAQRAAELNAKAVERDVARPEVQLAEARRELAMLREVLSELPEYPRSPMFQAGDLGAQLERIEFAGAEVRHLRAERARLRLLLDQAETALRKHAPPGQAGVVHVRTEIAKEMATPAWEPELVGGA